MPRHSGIWGEGWGYCDRCGFQHPLLQLTSQKGLQLCHCHGCIDDLEVETRMSTINEILSDDNTEHEDQRSLQETDTTELEF